MIFWSTDIHDAFLIELERIEDERGSFARTWCREEFEKLSLEGDFCQSSVSFNRRRGTLRGLHAQQAPFEEAKLVRCTAGEIYDVVVDIRPASPTYLRWAAFRLSSRNRLQLYVPPGCLHGFQTLADGAEVLYHMTTPHRAEAQVGYRWNDPAFGVEWPSEPAVISARDAAFADFPLEVAGRR